MGQGELPSIVTGGEISSPNVPSGQEELSLSLKSNIIHCWVRHCFSSYTDSTFSYCLTGLFFLQIAPDQVGSPKNLWWLQKQDFFFRPTLFLSPNQQRRSIEGVFQSSYIQTKWKSARRRRKHCALAVVRRSQKFSPRRRPPSRGSRTAKI